MPHKTIDLYTYIAGCDKVKSSNISVEFLSSFQPLHSFILLSLYKNVRTTLHFYGCDFYIETIKITMFI